MLREHLLDFFVAEVNLDDRVAAVLERDVVVVNIGWEEDLRVPCESLARREV
jgi:hypothetical protein